MEARGRIGTDLTVRVTFYDLNGDPIADTTPTCAAVDLDGNSLTVGTVEADVHDGYKAVITSPAAITRGTVEWTQNGVVQAFPIEWQSNEWPPLGALVNVERSLAAFDEPDLRRAHVALQDIVEEICGAPFARRFHRFNFTGTSDETVLLPHMWVDEILAVTVNDDAKVAADFVVDDIGRVWPPSGVTWEGTDPLNCTIDFTWGIEYPPVDLLEPFAGHLLHIAGAASRVAPAEAHAYLEGADGTDLGLVNSGAVPPWVLDAYRRHQYKPKGLL